MSVTDEGTVALLPTLTHARIRVLQGDPEAARRILERILSQRPDDREARALLEQISGMPVGSYRREREEAALAAPVPGDPAALAARFREAASLRPSRKAAVVRLSDWLGRIRESSERERDR